MSVYEITSLKFFFLALSLCLCLYIALTVAKKYCYIKLSLKKESKIIITIFYFIFVATVSFFPFSINYSPTMGAAFIPSNINYLPFSAFIYNIENLLLPFPSFPVRLLTFLEFFPGNILLFIPIGFMLPQLSKKFDNFTASILLFFIIAASKELIQFFESSYGAVFNRSANTDDLILNLIGGICGFFIFKRLQEKL